MKLAEALIQRADAQKRVQQLRTRLNKNATVQEGEEPAEDPTAILGELRRTLAELTRLIKAINATNIQTRFDEQRTLTDALAERDALMLERHALAGLAEAATVTQNRYSRSEIRIVPTVDVAALQAEVDDLARRYRELDTRIQQINWATELVEAN